MIEEKKLKAERKGKEGWKGRKRMNERCTKQVMDLSRLAQFTESIFTFLPTARIKTEL
jgi:hypothetical protein